MPPNAQINEHRLLCIILAAGLSTRMGRNKLLLPWNDDKCVIEQVISQVQASKFADALLVTGHQSTRLETITAPYGIRTVFNPNYKTGELLSSLQEGIRLVNFEAFDGFGVLLGDLPGLTADTINEVICRFQAGSIVEPYHGGRKGHPIIFDKLYADNLLKLPAHTSPSTVVRQHHTHVIRHPVKSAAIYRDVDTPDMYRELHAIVQDEDA